MYHKQKLKWTNRRAAHFLPSCTTLIFFCKEMMKESNADDKIAVASGQGDLSLTEVRSKAHDAPVWPTLLGRSRPHRSILGNLGTPPLSLSQLTPPPPSSSLPKSFHSVDVVLRRGGRLLGVGRRRQVRRLSAHHVRHRS